MSRPHLAELSVKDLALVAELRLELAPGLTVLTGETGAGKSMLVDALLAATGGRVAAGMVREGAERARVEAAFAGADDELILLREIQPSRAPARMNGETVPLAKLAERGAELVAIHGQGEQLRLARPAVTTVRAKRSQRQIARCRTSWRSASTRWRPARTRAPSRVARARGQRDRRGRDRSG